MNPSAGALTKHAIQKIIAVICHRQLRADTIIFVLLIIYIVFRLTIVHITGVRKQQTKSIVNKLSTDR